MAEPKETKPVKRRDVGLAGFALVLSQVLSTYQSTVNVTGQIEQLKKDLKEIKDNQELLFVRKEPFSKLESKVDKVNAGLSKLSKEVSSIRTEISLSSYREACEPLASTFGY